MKKNTILTKVLFGATIIFVLLGLFSLTILKIYRTDRDNAASNERNQIPSILCIGDSLTYGAGGDGMGYPEYIALRLDKEGYIIPVYNMGVGGENTVTIASRVGALPMTVDEFVIPADMEPVDIIINNAYNGKPVTPLRQGTQNSNGVNPCIIGDVEGTISIIQDSYSADDFKYTFTRLERGEEVHVKSGSVIETYARNNHEYKDGIFVVFIGANGGYNDIEDLVYQQQAIVDMQQKNADKYLILGISIGSASDNVELEDVMVKTYGEKYLNVRELLSDETVLLQSGVILTDIDRAQIEEGYIPDCVRADEVHFNSLGYQILAEAVYIRMLELNYMDDITSTADEFNNKWGWAHRLEIYLRGK